MQCEFVAARACAGPSFEPAEEILYPVADSIALFRIRHYSSAVGFSWNAVSMTKPLEFCPQFVTVETLVCDEQDGSLLLFKQLDDMCALIGLSGNEFQLQRSTAQIGHRHQLGVSPASGLAHGLCLRSSAGIGAALMHHNVCSVHEPDCAAVGFRDPAQHPGPQSGASPVTIVSKDRLPRAEFARQVTPRTGVSQAVE